MTSPLQLEILDLRHFPAHQLRPLLEGQANVWQARLHWDYRSATELLLQYLDSRVLPGFVALHGGRICGFTFCVYEGQKAVIGDLYADPGHPAPLAVVHTLARHLLDVLDASPDIKRIEAQLLLYDAGVLAPSFAPPASSGNAFRVFPRLFLETGLPSAPRPPAIPKSFELTRWTPACYGPAAQLIHASYAGHVDAEINDQYRTLPGSVRFLHNVVRFPGCGVFDPEASWVIRERQDPDPARLAALILCSRVAPSVAHVTQLCVVPDHRAAGLGHRLLAHCMAHLPALGYRDLTLTASEANTRALALYARAGFSTRHRFDALVLERSQPHRFNFAARTTPRGSSEPHA